jgi:hypothetical protein
MARNDSQPAAYSSFMVGVLVAREVGACSEGLTAPKQNPAAGVTVAGLLVLGTRRDRSPLIRAGTPLL